MEQPGRPLLLISDDARTTAVPLGKGCQEVPTSVSLKGSLARNPNAKAQDLPLWDLNLSCFPQLTWGCFGYRGNGVPGGDSPFPPPCFPHHHCGALPEAYAVSPCLTWQSQGVFLLWEPPTVGGTILCPRPLVCGTGLLLPCPGSAGTVTKKVRRTPSGSPTRLVEAHVPGPPPGASQRAW